MSKFNTNFNKNEENNNSEGAALLKSFIIEDRKNGGFDAKEYLIDKVESILESKNSLSTFATSNSPVVSDNFGGIWSKELIYRTIFDGATLKSGLRIHPGIKKSMDLIQANFNPQVKQRLATGQATASSGSTIFSARTLEVKTVDLTETFYPAALDDSFLSEWMSAGQEGSDDLGFIVTAIETGIFDYITENVDAHIWQGNDSSPSNAYPGFDGFFTIANSEVGIPIRFISGNTSPISAANYSAITVSTIVAEMNKLVNRAKKQNVASKSQRDKHVIYMDYDLYMLFNEYTTTSNSNFQYDIQTDGFDISFRGIKVVGAQLGTGRMALADPDKALAFGTDALGDTTKMVYGPTSPASVIYEWRVSFKGGVQFALPQEVVLYQATL